MKDYVVPCQNATFEFLNVEYPSRQGKMAARIFIFCLLLDFLLRNPYLCSASTFNFHVNTYMSSEQARQQPQVIVRPLVVQYASLSILRPTCVRTKH